MPQLTRVDGWPRNRGEWSLVKQHPEGQTNAVVCCPNCGKVAHLEDHEVTLHPDGTFSASPSVQCPQEGCTWHVTIAHSSY